MRRKLNKIKVISVTFILIAIIAIFNSFEFGSTNIKTEAVVIQENDTLWNIANTYCANDNSNIQNKISEIKKINNLKNSNIYAGQTIYIPL